MIHTESDTHASGTPSSLLAFAQAAVDLGICVLPTVPREKRPALDNWKDYQARLPTRQELQRWFPPQQQGLGLVIGEVSGNIEALDFDRYDVFIAFCEVLRGISQGDLLDRLIAGYQDRAPNGAHLLYRCEVIADNQKLANTYECDEHGEIKRSPKGKPLLKALIETRGDGGFLVVPPSHGRTHPSGKPYVQVSGGLSTIMTITAEERAILFDVARSLTEVQEEAKSEKRSQTKRKDPGGTRPGDIFAARASWEEILEPHDWVQVFERSGVGYWRRPGKDHGISATTNYENSDLLYVFSTSTDFESERGYGKFSAFALLNHGGDFTRAVEDLMGQGYGTNGNGAGVAEDEVPPDPEWSNDSAFADDGREDTEENEEQERKAEEERPTAQQWPCPDLLWRGAFARVAQAVGRKSWEVWIATLVALGAKAWRRIDYKYHRRLYGMVYALLIKATGMGKGLSTDLCRALMPEDPEDYVIRDAVQSGPALAPILAEIVRDGKGKIESCKSRPALLLIEEFTVLLKNAGIQNSALPDTINSLFHRTWPWNVSRSDRPHSGGGDAVIHDPTLSILATTTQALFKEYVSPQMIRSGFLNRFLVLPGDTTPWKFYDPEGAGMIVDAKLGLLDHLEMPTFNRDKTIWENYTPDALERMKEWGARTFEPIMRSEELDAESVKRLHVYAHVICLLYAWGNQGTRIQLDDVECSIAVIETARGFLQSLIAEDREPEVPKFKAYEISLEQRIVGRVRTAGEQGIPRRKVVSSLLMKKDATSPDLYALITKLVTVGTLVEVEEKRTGPGPKSRKLYLPEHHPDRRRNKEK